MRADNGEDKRRGRICIIELVRGEEYVEEVRLYFVADSKLRTVAKPELRASTPRLHKDCLAVAFSTSHRQL